MVQALPQEVLLFPVLPGGLFLLGVPVLPGVQQALEVQSPHLLRPALSHLEALK